MVAVAVCKNQFGQRLGCFLFHYIEHIFGGLSRHFGINKKHLLLTDNKAGIGQAASNHIDVIRDLSGCMRGWLLCKSRARYHETAY